MIIPWSLVFATRKFYLYSFPLYCWMYQMIKHTCINLFIKYSVLLNIYVSLLLTSKLKLMMKTFEKTLKEWDTQLAKISIRPREITQFSQWVRGYCAVYVCFIKISCTPRSVVSPNNRTLAIQTVRESVKLPSLFIVIVMWCCKVFVDKFSLLFYHLHISRQITSFEY